MQKLNAVLSQVQNELLSRTTFDPAIDCRNDLVNFYGFTREQVNNMSDSEVFSFIDSLDDCSEPEEKEILNIKCKCGHHEHIVNDYYDCNDSYEIICTECKNERFIHYTGYDAIREGY